MKIWFDILTPKQVMFFKPAVDILKKRGHKVLCTSRQYREAVELAKIKQLDLTIVGRHGGAERYAKLRESANRILELSEVVSKFDPEVAISFSSPEGARVAFGLGIKHIGFNDSPHAEAVARLTVPLINRLFYPWVIPSSAWTRFGISKSNITPYRALDPAAWLKGYRPNVKNEGKNGNKGSRAKQNGGSHNDADAIQVKDRKSILIRLEETHASYIADRKIKSRVNMIDPLIEQTWRIADIMILCRYEDQIQQVARKYEGKAKVIEHVIDGTALIASSDIFIGAGGTMTAEAALLGKFTVSIAPVRFQVERYLINSGLVKRAEDSKQLAKMTKKWLSDSRYGTMQQKKAKGILDSMDNPVEKMLSFLSKNA